SDARACLQREPREKVRSGQGYVEQSSCASGPDARYNSRQSGLRRQHRKGCLGGASGCCERDVPAAEGGTGGNREGGRYGFRGNRQYIADGNALPADGNNWRNKLRSRERQLNAASL